MKLGIVTLLLCFLFILITYFYFESSFSRNDDLQCIVRLLRQSVDQNAASQEDIAEYQMLLNVMGRWNEKEQYWQGANYIFLTLCNPTEEDSFEKTYILCYCFYKEMYLRNNEKGHDRAVFVLKEYIRQRDRQGWKEIDYMILWGMLHCLLTESVQHDVVCFLKWYLDFPDRSRKLERYHRRKENGCQKSGANVNRMLTPHIICMQTGILLIELELYFNRLDDENIDEYILRMLPRIWNEGNCILDEKNKKMRQNYLTVNTSYDFESDELDLRLQNLCSDYENGTKKSMMTYLK